MSERRPLLLGVVGGGTMGAGIAYAAARAGCEVVVVEREAHQRAALPGRVRADLARDLARAAIDEAALEATLGRVRLAEGLDELGGDFDLVVEAVPEELELKRGVLASIEARGVRRIATNTSSISVTTLSEALEAPEHLVGLHFFNPVRQMALVEIVVGAKSSAELVEYCRSFVARLDKTALVVRDSPGFLTSRLGVALGLEAIRMAEEGLASPAEIDQAMVLGYGHPMGPLRLSDLVGLDVRLGIARVLEAAYGERFAPPALLEQMVAEGRLGRKTGGGFFEWPGA